MLQFIHKLIAESINKIIIIYSIYFASKLYLYKLLVFFFKNNCLRYFRVLYERFTLPRDLYSFFNKHSPEKSVFQFLILASEIQSS